MSVIKKKRYYFYSIRWVDIMGEADHAHPSQFEDMNYCTLITYGFVFVQKRQNKLKHFLV